MLTGALAVDLLDEADFYDLTEEAPPHLRRKAFAACGVLGVPPWELPTDWAL